MQIRQQMSLMQAAYFMEEITTLMNVSIQVYQVLEDLPLCTGSPQTDTRSETYVEARKSVVYHRSSIIFSSTITIRECPAGRL